MKDDHLQGILFNRSETLEFGGNGISKQFIDRAKSLVKQMALRSKTATVRARSTHNVFFRDTELGDFIDIDASDIASRLRRS